MCHLDFLTASDVAFALWQYFNSHDDWERKLNDRTKAYKHKTKWSTDKTGMSMTEGYKVYNELLDWCGKLKKMSKSEASDEDKECYKDLRVSCNKMAKKLGLVRVRDVPKMDVAEEIDLAEAREAAVHSERDVPNTVPPLLRRSFFWGHFHFYMISPLFLFVLLTLNLSPAGDALGDMF